jgi:hypothetical protein
LKNIQCVVVTLPRQYLNYVTSIIILELIFFILNTHIQTSWLRKKIMFLSTMVSQKLQLEFWWGSIGGPSWNVSVTTRILNDINLGLGQFFAFILEKNKGYLFQLWMKDNQYLFPFGYPKIDDIIPFDNKMFYIIHDTIIRNFVACTIFHLWKSYNNF